MFVVHVCTHRSLSPSLSLFLSLLLFSLPGADLRALCTEAAFGPLRSVVDISSLSQSAVRPISMTDFLNGLKQVRASVSTGDLAQYVKWNSAYGSFNVEESMNAS